MPLSDPNDGIECDEWYREAGLFRPLCGQPFYPAVSDNTCDVCVTPHIPSIAESPCSIRMLPDPLKTYFLAIDAPSFAVSFNYPSLSPWLSQVIAPQFSAGRALAGPWPVNESFVNASGFRYDWNLGASGNVWGDTVLTGINPVIHPMHVLNPGDETEGSVFGYSGSRRICSSTVIAEQIVRSVEVIRNSTIVPVADATIKPQVFPTRTTSLHQVKVRMTLTCTVHTKASPLNWDGPDTVYAVSASFGVQHIVNSMQAWYTGLSGSAPWGYPGSELFPYNFVPPADVRNAYPPTATCTKLYQFETTDKAAFMSASSFVLTPLAFNRPLVSVPAVPMYDLTDHTTIRSPETSPDWIEAPFESGQWASAGPFAWQKRLHSSGVMSTGWPSSIRVIRGAF